jgi:hypothetical protein
MKNLILFTILFLNSFLVFGQYEKTFIKSFNVNSDNIVFDIDCPKTISTWGNSYIKVELVVNTNFKPEIMDVFVKNGRYNFEVNNEKDVPIISIPKIKNKVRLQDKDLIETFNLKIWLPESTKLKQGISL